MSLRVGDPLFPTLVMLLSSGTNIKNHGQVDQIETLI